MKSFRIEMNAKNKLKHKHLHYTGKHYCHSSSGTHMHYTAGKHCCCITTWQSAEKSKMAAPLLALERKKYI